MTTNYDTSYYKRTNCRACGNADLKKFINLGPTPLANSFLRSADEFETEAIFPLDVYFCEECSLVQLLDVVNPEILFRDYIYVSGTTKTVAAHNAKLTKTILDFLKLQDQDLVVEVASNCGCLLECFQKQNIRVLGIEPARNLAEMAIDAGIETVCEFFNSATAEKILAQYGRSKVVIGNNVLAHVDDTQDFLKGCKRLLDDDGMIVIEVPYLREFIERSEYDTVYHEHLCYFSVNALIRLCDTVGLSIVRLDPIPIHGGSLRMFAGSTEYFCDHAKEVRQMAAAEIQSGLSDLDTYERFAANVKSMREQLRTMLIQLKADGKSVAGYGAPAKGNTLLNYCDIDVDLVSFTVDANPLKVGLLTPGSHLPILPVSAVIENQPDYLLILAWNFAEEIMKQEQEYQLRGGKFILPIPTPRIV